MPVQDNARERLAASALFSGLAPQTLTRILAAGRWLEVPQHRFVYRQGDEAGNLYLIASGEVELILDAGSGGQLRVGHIGASGHFGETSLLTGNCNSLSVLAVTDLTLLVFDREAFNTVLLADPLIQYRLNVSLAKRLRVSFLDHANSLARQKSRRPGAEHMLDPSFFTTPASDPIPETTAKTGRPNRFSESSIRQQMAKAVSRFANSRGPVLITGESGTGRRLAAFEIHAGASNGSGSYAELDVRTVDPVQMEVELFGYGGDPQDFSQLGQLGLLERMQGGTVVLYNAEYLEPEIQRHLARAIGSGSFTRVRSEVTIGLRTRLIFICQDAPRPQEENRRLLPELAALLAPNHFPVAPLREHRRDIPRLVRYYLKRYSLQYGKEISRVDDQTLGKLMHYDWPGNLTELAGVLQRAVVLGKSNEPLTDEIVLGVPRSEGKWEFNLLRFRTVRAFVASRFFPVLPRAVVGLFFFFVLATLFFGPISPEHNIGLTLSWVIGWPLMIFAFFFLARTWCSICGLSVPGWLAQMVLKPNRPTPRFIRHYSGWIMAILCVTLFWIETTWNAYGSPRLTAWIILSITLGSLIFSIFFRRRVWCRYLCPLGAINALFSMPSVLELRANSQVCLNRCGDHACYAGNDNDTGCPMFRHPFLVDNNRDCILCGQCVRNCKLNSIHLNLRLAPQELWNQQNPRLADSFLVVSLAAIFYPFALSQKSPELIDRVAAALSYQRFIDSHAFAASLVFFVCLAVYLAGYAFLSRIIARQSGNSWMAVASLLGYGMIPLVLGAFMAVHLDMLVGGLWLLPVNLMELAGLGEGLQPTRVISGDATFVLQVITVFGGLIASLYANRRIIGRLDDGRHGRPLLYSLPALLLWISAVLYLQFM